MKKKNFKTLQTNKLVISKFDEVEQLKGGSVVLACHGNTIYPACPTGIICPANGGSMSGEG